jgi:AraC-like DNA-binding protein
MPGEIREGRSFELSTLGLSPTDGLSSLQDLFDTKVQLRFVADAEASCDARMLVKGFPGLRLAKMSSTMNVTLIRHRQMLADQEDDVCLILNTGKALSIQQGKRLSCALTGEAALLVYREPATISFYDMNYIAIRVPFSALAPLTGNLAANAGRVVRGDTAALGLLVAYVNSLPDHIDQPVLRGLITTQVYDLMALTIGATAEGREIALQRGVKAARLQAVKEALSKDRSISIWDIARMQGISPRYVQKLFEESGTTFTEYLLALRLEAARMMLASPRYAGWTIVAIALEAGFGDLSYFNRRFKARYERTPSDVRAGAASLSRDQ